MDAPLIVPPGPHRVEGSHRITSLTERDLDAARTGHDGQLVIEAGGGICVVPLAKVREFDALRVTLAEGSTDASAAAEVFSVVTEPPSTTLRSSRP
jgi:hypothetical protein